MGQSLLLGHILVQADGLDHLFIDPHGRVQCGHGLLEDHAHLTAADVADLGVAGFHQVDAVQRS